MLLRFFYRSYYFKDFYPQTFLRSGDNSGWDIFGKKSCRSAKITMIAEFSNLVSEQVTQALRDNGARSQAFLRQKRPRRNLTPLFHDYKIITK